MNEENSRTVFYKISNVYFLVKPDLRILSRHAPSDRASQQMLREGRVKPTTQSRSQKRMGFFCDKAPKLPDFCKK
jgi:hypothetical protein